MAPNRRSPGRKNRELELARKLKAGLTPVQASVVSHGAPKPEVVQSFVDTKQMGLDLVFSHGGWTADSEMAAMQRSGAGIVGTPDTELQMGMGYPVVWHVADLDCRTCLGLGINSNQGNGFVT